MKITKLLIIVILLLVVSVITVSAQSLNYDSSIQVQNLSETDTATIAIVYYNQDGSEDTTFADTIAPGKNKAYFPIQASTGFNGSVVISSDTPVAAIVNVVANNFSFGASYDSFSSGSETVSMPVIFKNNSNFNTWFNVQNAGTTNTTVNVAYAGTVCTEQATIAPGAAKTFDQANNGCLPSPYIGAATITAQSGGSIVASGVQLGPTTLFAYNGFTGGSNEIIMPLINANNSGFITGIQVQNAGNSSTNVTLSYEPALENGKPAGTACTETKTVPPGESRTFSLYAFTFTGDPQPGTTTCVRGSRFVGSASVTTNSSSQPLVSVVNQLNLSTNKGSAYNGFNPGQSTETVVMPLIMDRNSGYFTGINIVNVSNTASTVTCTYTSSNGAVSKDFTSPSIGLGESFNHLQLNFLANGFVGSGVCVANTPGAKLIGVVNELGSSPTSDQLFSYEGFNK